MAVFDGGRYPTSAEATSSTTLLRLSADSFRQTCLKNPEMALKVFKVLAHRLRHLMSLVEELSFATVRARLIAYLVRLAEENGHRTPQGIHFQLTENNEQLAVRLGTVRELISRNLGRLYGDRLIEMNKRTVNIPDLAMLRDEIGVASKFLHYFFSMTVTKVIALFATRAVHARSILFALKRFGSPG